MAFQFLSVRNGGVLQMAAKVFPIGFMKRTSRLHQFVILRHILFQNSWNETLKWWHGCWWRVLETKCVDDQFMMLMTDLMINDKMKKHLKSVTILKPHIAMSPTSLSPIQMTYSEWVMIHNLWTLELWNNNILILLWTL